MEDINIVGSVVENILIDLKINNRKSKKLVKLLKQKTFQPIDLILLDEYSEDFEEHIGEIIETVIYDMLVYIGTGAFATALSRMVQSNEKDREIIKQVIYFLEHEDQTEFDTRLFIDLGEIALKSDNDRDSMLIIFVIKKIQSLSIDSDDDIDTKGELSGECQ